MRRVGFVPKDNHQNPSHPLVAEAVERLSLVCIASLKQFTNWHRDYTHCHRDCTSNESDLHSCMNVGIPFWRNDIRQNRHGYKHRAETQCHPGERESRRIAHGNFT